MIKLLNGDCIVLLDTIEDNSIDCIITDPPYNISKENDNRIILPSNSILYVKAQHGYMPVCTRELYKINVKEVQFWDGKNWKYLININKYNMDKNAIQITLRNGEKINLLKDSKVLVKNKGIINCSEISVGDIIYNTALPNTEKETPYILTDGILWLIGLYLAEGSHSDDCIQLSLNSDEFCWYQKISDTIKQLDGSCTYSINGNSLSIRIHSCIFNSILKKYLCGEIAKNKHLSNSCWQLNNHCLEQILMGYLDGDGCNRKIYSNGSRYRLSFTFNQPLSQDIRILSSRLGFHLVLQKKHIQYNNKKHSIFYGELVIPNEHFRKCKERFEIIKVQESNCTSFYELIIDSDQLIMPSGYSIVAENIKDKKIICEENK